MSMISSPQEGPKGSSFIGKMQEINQTCQENILFTHGFRSVHKPGFVHVISWPSSRHEWVAGGLNLSSGHALSNKTNCRSFGGRLPPQISCWSQVLQTVSVLDSFGNGSVWTPNAPPFELQLLWLEINSKILSNSHKNLQLNYPLVELLTSKRRIKNPLTG